MKKQIEALTEASHSAGFMVDALRSANADASAGMSIALIGVISRATSVLHEINMLLSAAEVDSNIEAAPRIVILREGLQYGAKVYKPGCAASHAFARIAKTETMTPCTINQIKELGYTVKVEGRPEVTL